MVQNAHVAGDNFVLEYSAGRNIDTITVIGNDDDSALWREIVIVNRVQSLDSHLSFQLTRSETPRPKVTSPLTVK